VKPKLLIVDDDPHIRRLLRIYLRDTPYDVFEAANAHEAESLMAQNRFDLILLDLVLPYYGGFGLCQRFKSADPAPYVIMITGEDSPETRETARQCGVDDFVAKPFQAAELRDKVTALAPDR
jgi:DNA-binding response OmpR family regulator